MSGSGSLGWIESRIEQALLWFERIVLFVLLVSALLRQEFQEAAVMATALAIHGLVYWTAPRMKPVPWRRWAVTLVDLLLVSLAFYLTGNVAGQVGILGFCLAGVVAARLSFWRALSANLGLWLIFTLPFIYFWLWQNEPFPLPIVGNLFIYLAVSFAVNYFVSMEARQSRIARDASLRLQQLATVYQVGQTVTSTLDLESVLTLVVSKAVEILNAEAGSLLLLAPDDTDAEEAGPGELVFRVVLGPAAGSLVGRRLPPGEGIAGAVLQSGEGQYVNNVHQDRRWYTAPDVATGFETRSILCVPLTSRDRSIGVLEVINKRDRSPFTDEDLQLLSTFAAQAAIALENARLFEEVNRLYERTDEALNRRLWELGTIEEIDHKLGASLDYERVIDLVLERAIEACNATHAAVGILTPDGQRLDLRFWRAGAAEPADTTPFEATAGWPVERGIVGRVARTGQSALVADVTTDPEYEAIVPATRSEVAVPIKREGRVIGVLNLESDKPAAFSEEDLHFVEHLADHAGMAIENARLFREEQRRAADLATLNRVSAAVSSVLDPDEVLKTIVDSVIQVAGCQKAAIFVLDAAHNRLSLRMSQGLSEAYVAAAQDIEITPGSRAQVLLGDEPLVVTDIETDPRLQEFVPLAREEGFRALADVPLKGREVVLGEFTVYYAEPHDFSATELETLKAFADQAAVAIQNARLFETQQRQLRELGILFETSAAVSSSLALGEVLGAVARQMAHALDVSSCSISDWDPMTNVVTTLVAEATTPDLAASLTTGDVGASYSLADYVATAEALRKRQPCVIQLSDPSADPAERELLAQMGQRSLLMVPLVAHDQVVGLVELYESRHERQFSEDDIRLCQAMASQAAIAIENARLYARTDERLRTRVDELMALQRITQELNATLDRERILQIVLESAIQTTGATHGNVMLVDPDGERLMLPVAIGYSPEEQAVMAQTLTHPRSDSLTYQVVKSGKARIVDNVRQELCTVGVRKDTMSALAVPIFYQDAVVGLINLRHTEVEAFDQEDLSFVQALAEQVSLAIGNAFRFEDQVRVNNALRQRTDQMDSLLQVSQKLRTDVPLEETLHEVAYAIQETVGFNVVLISVVEDWQSETPMSCRVASAGLPLEVFEAARQVRQPLEQYTRILREEYRQGLCYFFPFQRREDWEPGLHTIVPMPEIEEWEEGQWHPRDMLLAPLRGAGGRLLGHISVDEPRDGRRPSRQTLEVLAIFANQAAIAVENATLYADAQRRADSLALINKVGQNLAQILEPAQVLDTVVRAVAELLRCELSSVYQMDEYEGKFCAVASHGVDLARMGDLRFAPGEGLVGQVAMARTPLLIPDTDQEPRFVPRPVPIGSMMFVPIVAGRQVIGVLTAGSAQKHALTEADQVLLTTLADQAAVALESARLFAGTQRAAERLSLLNEIGRRAAAQLELQEMLDTTVQALHQHLGFFRVAVFLISGREGGRELYAAAANDDFWSIIPPDFRQQVGEGLIGAAAASGKTILEDETLSPAGEQPFGVSEWSAPARLAVPIKVGGEVIGVLEAEASQPRAFREEDAAALEIAADQLAVAIQNASLFQERQKRIEQLAVVNEMAQAVSSTLELDELLGVVYQQISRLVDTTHFYIALYDAERDKVSFPFVVRPERGEPREEERELASRVIEARKPLLLPTAQQAGAQVQPGPGSWLGVPMIAEDKVLGVIAVQSTGQDDEEHLNLLSTVAAQAAVSVRNAQLYRQIVHFSSELEEIVQARTRDLEQALAELTIERDRVATLYRITSELGATLDLERVLQRALQLFADALGVEHGTITLLDQETGYLVLKATLEKDRELMREGWRTHLKQGVGLAGWVLENRTPLLVADVTEDPRWVEFESRSKDGAVPYIPVRSVVAVPLSLGGGDILGVLTLAHPEVDYFTKEHLQMVTAAAAQVAIAVNNSDLYAFITDQADQLGTMVQAQQAEAAKNRAILESIADGVLVLDENGRVLLVNPAVEEMLGISAMALEGTHFRDMLGLGETPTDRALAQMLYAELRDRLEATDVPQDSTRFQAGMVRLESGGRALAVNIAPLIAPMGGSPGLVAALRDISREAEVERLKNEFISTVSHELRTPMTSIKGYTDLLFLGMAGGLTDAQRNFLQIIKSNADRLTALVNDILDISRIETGRLRLSIEPLSLGEIITQTVAAFLEQYREKGLELEWEEPEGLPGVRGDAARVTQILNNLIANAWQYTPSGGRVTVSVRSLDSFLQVDVTDTGIGIDASDLGRIFDRFYRVDHPVVQEAGGTGLGLSIVKMFVEMLGGEIWVESEPEVGSTFSFTLPLVTTEMPEVALDLTTTEPPVVVGRRPKILVVEDDRDLALLLRRQLEAEGYQVLLTGSGEDALWLAKEELPQLITLDMMLPDMDGFVVLERLKEHSATAPIPVVITSVLAEADKGYSLGAVDYVVKPFSEEKLLEAVRQALSPVDRDKPYSLLVVDDDLDILGLMQEALSFHGYQVSAASGGQEALDRVQESPPDLILLDLKMPGVDGYEVIRQLKGDQATRSIPIIVITASPVDKEKDKVRVLGMGATQYMTKPLSIELLIREIKKAIEEK